MAAINGFILQNLWISYVSIIIWSISIILMLKVDLRILRGRGDFKDKKGEFESRGITFAKILFLGIILWASFVFSLPLLERMPLIILATIVIVTFIVFIPTEMTLFGPKNDFGLRWLINLIDKYDNKKKHKPLKPKP